MIFEQRYKLKDFALILTSIDKVLLYDPNMCKETYNNTLSIICENRYDIIGKSKFGFDTGISFINCLVPDLDEKIVLVDDMIESHELSKIKLL